MRIYALFTYCFLLMTAVDAIGAQLSKITQVENGLRYKVLITNSDNKPMKLSERMKYYKAPAVSIAVVDNGRLDWAKGYGIHSNPAHDKINQATLFQAGSVSKTVTALGALILVNQGKLSLDVDVNKYLKSWKIKDDKFKQKVTLRRLLSHSAGLNVPGFFGYSIHAKLPTTVEILEGKRPTVNTNPVKVIFEPGTKYKYSGGGTTIVQLLIEDITGEDFATWMDNNVLQPLNMNSSSFKQPISHKNRWLACFGHNADGTEVAGHWHVYPEKAAAGLWTIPSDLAKFMIAIFGMLNGNTNKLVSQDLIKEAISPQIKISDQRSEGLGVFLSGEGATFTFGHDGENKGFVARYLAFPNRNFGMVIMVNDDGAFELIDEISHSIADAYDIPNYEKVLKTSKSFNVDLYKNAVGVYQRQKGNDDDKMIVTMHDNKLYVSSPILKKTELYLGENDRFFVKEGVVELKFSQDDKTMKLFALDGNSDNAPKLYTNMDQATHLSKAESY